MSGRLAAALVLLSVAGAAAGQGRAPAPLPADEAGRCRYGAEHMIEFGRRALDEPGARHERVAQRRKLLDQWSARLRRGEDPCVVYLDIQKAATTF